MSAYLDNYSPFDDTAAPPPPVQNAAPTPRADPTEDELAAYEERLNALEQSLSRQETELADARAADGDLPPNWPKCYPLVHFDLGDVPEETRAHAKSAFFCWVIMAVAFALNWIGTLSLLSVKDTIDSPGSKIALSSLYLFVIVPLALDLDAMAVYNVLRRGGGTFDFLKVFIALGVTCIFELVLAVGMESSGSVGLITTIDLFSNKYAGVGVFSLLVTAALGFAAFMQIRCALALWAYYRGTSSGQTMEDDVRRSMADLVVDALN